MSSVETTTPETWGGLTAVELGVLIGGLGLAVLLLIVCCNCIYFKCRSKEKKPKKGKHVDEKMVNMQTSRIVDGQAMQQVIVRSQPNGNMDKYKQHDIPYQTMDPETNTVRYDTAKQSTRQEPQVAVVAAQEKSKTASAEPDDGDSGTGESPVRTAVIVHSEIERREERDSEPASKRSSSSEGVHSNPSEAAVSHPIQGNDNAAYESDKEEPPSPYAYSVPPPPSTEPPPLTPGIPVTDLDEGETIIVPPPPPLPQESIYAQINKNRAQTTHAGISREESMKRSIYRPSSEIQIIEKEKF